MHFRFQMGQFRLQYGEPPTPTIYLVRHGESQTNVDRALHLKIADHQVPLSSKGREQREETGEFLANHFAALGAGRPKRVRVYHSDYRRAIETADGILRHLNNHSGIKLIEDREDGRLREMEFGIPSGLSHKEIAEKFPDYKRYEDLLRQQGGKYYVRRLGGESPADVEVRLRHFFAAIYRDQEKYGINTFIVVCHGLTMRVFIKAWCKLNLLQYDAIDNPDNCSVHYIGWSKKYDPHRNILFAPESAKAVSHKAAAE